MHKRIQNASLRENIAKKYIRYFGLLSNWDEKSETSESELTDDDVVVYLWDDFTVVRGPIIPEKGLVFDPITSEWQQFCVSILQFGIPEELCYVCEQQEESRHQANNKAQLPYENAASLTDKRVRNFSIDAPSKFEAFARSVMRSI